ncbi:aldose 1-epimerase [Oerskovia turbata]|uniref:Aldose 1-epimerase n=1 Tax=Oerskovia turbata TaxID=1713 RepID=A0A4Q1L233_9CELL|nr:aldose 1-epimerase [Oerskovia turbata]RXR27284.1 aldose 1-epimerase [Oerskovia turbata]RXR36142.1 aldose 1-epimerase [Oerskovia turbata]TGJ94785.1 aldose 1-epimerase [Actinotalea fermentans ATCC 43279 = JCM 9966 = DSM 3133]
MTSATVCSNAYIVEGTLGALPTVTLVHPSGAELVVALRGATVLAWRAPWTEPSSASHDVVDLLDGYATEQALLAQDATRSGLMFPFANRIAGGKYVFDGVTHHVPPVAPGETQTMHGFARVLDWEVVSEEGVALHGAEGADGASGAGEPEVAALTLVTEIRGADVTGYPFDLETRIRFELTERTLVVTWTYRNAGRHAAPVTAGWHPYFRIPGHDTIDGLELDVPARATVATDATLLPLHGEAARVVRDAVGPVALAETCLDTAFTDLVTDADGRARTRVLDPSTGAGIELWQERGNMHVYTGDGLSERARASIALEPVESMTNAFNREDCAQDVRLAPGEERVFRFGVCIVAPHRS